MRLIDKDAVIELTWEEPSYTDPLNVLTEVRDRIKELPTVDAVPVIRCYECKYFKEFEKGFSTDWDGSCKYWNTHSTVYSNFCGCAERKEE